MKYIRCKIGTMPLSIVLHVKNPIKVGHWIEVKEVEPGRKVNMWQTSLQLHVDEICDGFIKVSK